MKQIGEGHPTPSSSPITILGIAHGPGQIKQFCGQIHDLLKKWVLVQVEPSESEEVKFQTAAFCEYFVFSCLIRKGINLGPPDLESPQKGASGNTHIFHFSPYHICPKITPSLPYR